MINYAGTFSLKAFGSAFRRDIEHYRELTGDGDYDQYDIRILNQEGAKALKATLVWTDYPGSPKTCTVSCLLQQEAYFIYLPFTTGSLLYIA